MKKRNFIPSLLILFFTIFLITGCKKNNLTTTKTINTDDHSLVPLPSAIEVGKYYRNIEDIPLYNLAYEVMYNNGTLDFKKDDVLFFADFNISLTLRDNGSVSVINKRPADLKDYFYDLILIDESNIEYKLYTYDNLIGNEIDYLHDRNLYCQNIAPRTICRIPTKALKEGINNFNLVVRAVRKRDNIVIGDLANRTIRCSVNGDIITMLSPKQ